MSYTKRAIETVELSGSGPDGYREYRRVSFLKAKNLPEFSMKFSGIGNLRRLATLTRGGLLVLEGLADYLEHDTNLVHLSPDLRKNFYFELSMPSSNFSVYLKELVEKGFLKKLSRNTFMMDPEVYWRGKLINQPKAISEWKSLIDKSDREIKEPI